MKKGRPKLENGILLIAEEIGWQFAYKLVKEWYFRNFVRWNSPSSNQLILKNNFSYLYHNQHEHLL